MPLAHRELLDVAARLLLRLAFDGDWPGRHHPREQMAGTVATSPLGWYVEKFGRYPFQPR